MTRRERKILARFARGRLYAQISQDLGVKLETARNAIYLVQDKLGMAQAGDRGVGCAQWPAGRV